ncbi:MAG TPA: hypothetical protein VK593_00555 [Edaphobacter sp.]|nr:hypothetical protein [Edaphobacter sp.]
MKSPEEDIERVLIGLRDSTIPDGMERRILAALEDRAASPSRQRMTRPAWRKTAAACSMAMAAALALVFVVPAIRRPVHAPQRLAAVAVPPKPLPAANANSDLAVNKQPSATTRPKLRRVRANPDPTVEPAVVTGSTNHPAPPMPLTEQERLLLRIANQRAPVELAELSQTQRAMQDEQRRKDFEQFFKPPQSPNMEINDATKQPSENKTE